MNYQGTIIEESLTDKSVLKLVIILETKVEKVVKKHQTPWLKKWTLHKVEIPEERIGQISMTISKVIDSQHDHPWYADYKNPKWHYIIFPHKVFKIARDNTAEYSKAKEYGISLGIPEYQVDFSPNIQ